MKKIFAVVLAIFIFASVNVAAFAENSSGEEIVDLSDEGNFLSLHNIDDLSSVDGDYPKLNEIYLENCTVKADEEIFSNPKIKTLYFNNCRFADGELNIPENVKNLILSDIKAIPSLKAKGDFKEIEVYDCVMKDLTGFSNMGKVDRMSFDNCRIGTISGVEKGNEIMELCFDEVPIESIEGIDKVKGLRRLDISSTAVRDLTPLKDIDLYFLAVHDCFMIENLEVIMEIETLDELGSVNCQMLYTPEIVAYLEENNINSFYEKGDLELREKLLKKCREIEKKYMTDEERIGAAVQFVCDSIVYDYEVYDNDNLTIQYADYILKYAFEGTGCCSTYAGLVSMMLNEMGIDCYTLSGDNHVWNLVELDGYSYWLDATWIDTGWNEYLDDSPYYMTSSENFLESHSDLLTPYRIINNSHSFDGVFKCDTRFRIQDEYTESEEQDVTPTLPEATTDSERAEEDSDNVEESTKELITEKATKTEEKATENKEKSKKPVLIASLSVVCAGAVAAVAVIAVKKRKQVNS